MDWFDIIKDGSKLGIGDSVISLAIEELQHKMVSITDLDKRELDGISGIRLIRNTLEELYDKHMIEHNEGNRLQKDIISRNAATKFISGRGAMLKLVAHLRKRKSINFPRELLDKNSFTIPTKDEWRNPFAK